MFSVMFWGCLVITLLALALAGPQRNGTGDTVRRQCLSAAFETCAPHSRDFSHELGAPPCG